MRSRRGQAGSNELEFFDVVNRDRAAEDGVDDHIVTDMFDRVARRVADDQDIMAMTAENLDFEPDLAVLDAGRRELDVGRIVPAEAYLEHIVTAAAVKHVVAIGGNQRVIALLAAEHVARPIAVVAAVRNKIVTLPRNDEIQAVIVVVENEPISEIRSTPLQSTRHGNLL